MADEIILPIGVELRSNVEYGPDRAKPYKARVQWTIPGAKKRESTSESFETEDEANAWIARMQRSAAQRIDPKTATHDTRRVRRGEHDAGAARLGEQDN